MQKMLENEGKERLNNNEFRELIPHLPFGDLLRIEYRKDKWYKLITVVDPIKKLYGCTLCSITNSNAKNLNAHMEGKKHKMNIQDVKQLYHPEYTYVKQDWKLAAGPIKSQPIAKTQATQKSKANEVSIASPSTSKVVQKTQAEEKSKENYSSLYTSSKTKQTLKMPHINANNVKEETPALSTSSRSTNLKVSIENKVNNFSKNQNIQKGTPSSNSGLETPNIESLDSTNSKYKAEFKTSIDKNKITTDTAESTEYVENVLINIPSKKNIQQELPRSSEEKVLMVATKSVKTSINKTASSSNIKKEHEAIVDSHSSDPYTNDPSWNPKVSVKNINVTKIIKTSTSQEKTNMSAHNIHKTKAPNMVAAKSTSVIEKKIDSQQVSEIHQKDKLKNLGLKDSNASVNRQKPTPLSQTIDQSEVLSNCSVENANKNFLSATPAEIGQTIQCEKNTEGREPILKSNERISSEVFLKTTLKDSHDLSVDVQLDEKKKESQDNLVKNPFALKHDGSKPFKIPKKSCVSEDELKNTIDSSTIPAQIQEVIVIDDDVYSEDKNFNTITYKQIPIIERHVPKPQRIKLPRNATQDQTATPSSKPDNASKRNLEIEKNNAEDGFAKKPKMIINPAAAYLVDASASNRGKEQLDKNNETPKYQTDRIIIPTKHKNKGKLRTNSDSEAQFDFSIKTFSSKPKDDDIHGLVGVEYVVKIMKGRDDSKPRYECSLCELILNGPCMQNHLVGYNHRLKFCEKHFPTAIRQYRQYIEKVPSHEKYKVLTPILAKLAVAIEHHHGRDLPYEVLEYQYNGNRQDILSKVFSCRHASEQHGPTFAHVLDVKEIDAIIDQKDNFKPQVGPLNQIFNVRSAGFSTISSKRREHNRQRLDIVDERSEVTRMQHSQPYYVPSQYEQHLGSSDLNSGYIPQVDDETHKKMVADFLRGTHKSLSPIYTQREQRDYQRHSRRSRSRDRTRKRSRSRSDTNYGRKSISPLRDGDIWQAYRHLVDQKLHDLNEVFKIYRNDPETHPMYNEEWQKFWKRRKDELISSGIDHRSYNYQPEWVRFFNVRIEELFSQEFENLKVKCRGRLCLSLENTYLSDQKYHVQGHNSFSVTPQMDANSQQLKSELQERYSASNIEVIPVLRLLTALEEYLGSLGPKIIDLMSKALLEEKSNPKEINDTILTIDNCTLLETAMEKLKGVLLAGLLEKTKERAFRKVIADTESLLARTEKNRKYSTYKTTSQNSHKHNSANILPAPVPAPSVLSTTQPQLQSTTLGSVPTHASNTKGSSASISSLLAQMDKKELATKLAATLTAQGKTDFNPDQLEQLIAVYTLIEKKKREAAAAAGTNSCTLLFKQQNSSMTKKTLSDTLVDFMNPSNPNLSTPASERIAPQDSSAKQSYTAATINRYLDVMRRTGGVFPKNTADGIHANEIWNNLQNIQRSLEENTDMNKSKGSQLSNLRNNLAFSNVSSFNRPNQFGFSNITANGSLNMNSDIQSSFKNSPIAGIQLNTLESNLSNNRNSVQQQYQQQNFYTSNLSAPYRAGGSMFTNTNNNNRVLDNINSNTYQPLQPRKNIPSLQSLQVQPYQSKPSSWTSNASESFSGTQRWRNQKGGEGVGSPRNVNERSGGKNQIWRNN